MRPRTIRFASPAFAARSTLIPFASRAATVRVMRSSSATAANRRLSDRSRSGWSSLLIDVLSCVGRIYLHLQTEYRRIFAYARRSATRRLWSLGPARGEQAAWRPRYGCLALPAAGTRHARAPARDRSRE